MKKKISIWIFLSLVFHLFLLGTIGISWFAYRFHPQTLPGGWFFQGRYLLAWNRPALLKKYNQLLHQNGYHQIPSGVHQFLCNEFGRTTSSSEKEAILDFYANQAGGGEGPCMTQIGEEAIPILLKQAQIELEKQSPYAYHIFGTLLLIEEIRVGEQIYKPYLAPKEELDTFREVLRLYKIWWNKITPWEEKRNIDPLRQTIYSWRSL